MPSYLSFEPILNEVSAVINKEKRFAEFKSKNPKNFEGVNYSILSNKDGKFAWRPLELIHPAIYFSLVNVICDPENWEFIQRRFSEFNDCDIECCSVPVISLNNQTDVAAQISKWWQSVEQQSLICSLEFSHLLHTDIVDCYGSLYTHSISWALHGVENSKQSIDSALGDEIDMHIRAGRFGQTNGISQGSVLMDFVAEIVLGFVDQQIIEDLARSANMKKCHVL